MSSSKPWRVKYILSATNSDYTSRLLASCQIQWERFFWASWKFMLTFVDVTMQKIARSSAIWLDKIFPKILVFGSSIDTLSKTFIFPSANFALRRLYKAFSFIFAFRFYEYTLGLAPWALPPFERCGALLSPILARPDFFWALIFWPEPAVMALFLVRWDLNLFNLLRYEYKR